MSFFKKLFGGGDDTSKTEQPKASKKVTQISRSEFTFGRYTDRNKTSAQRAEWGKSTEAFKAKNYLVAHTHLMEYIKDVNINNLNYTVNGEELKFEMTQGSNIIRGVSNKDKFNAISQIAQMTTPSIPVMRKLMSMNYGLKYSKFALQDDMICMKFTSLPIDASPNKIYYGLQELARKADQQDDLLVSEFSSISEIESENTINLNEAKQTVQIKYIRKWISDTMKDINELDADAFQGGIAFMLLSLTYKLDYLITPHGKLMESLEKIHSVFFTKNNDTTHQRNVKIIEIFNEISNWEDAKFTEGLYDTISTYSLVNPTDHKTVMNMIFDEMKKSDWYVTNNHPKIVQSIFEYSISYAFFSYGMQYPTMHIFDMMMNIFNPEFYSEIGIDTKYVNPDGTLNGTEISARLNTIVQSSKSEFPKIDFKVNNIKYDSMVNFYKSLMTETDYLNYSA